MPNIPFPNVPEYPGVPPLLRAANAAIASSPALAIGIGVLETILGNALQQPVAWGIFDQDGNQLGLSASGNSIVQAITSQLTGLSAPVLSTVSFDFTGESKVSDYQVEQGGFASYNKVTLPGSPVVTLALAGTVDDRTSFLTALEAARVSTDLFSVVTPEITYVNYTVARYTMSRRADKGATLLMVDVSLEEIRQVSAAFTQQTSAPITNPQDPGATSQVNNGLTQTAPPNSTLLNIMNGFGVSN